MNASEERGNRVSGTEKTNGLYLDVCGPQGDASRASLGDEGQWPEPYIKPRQKQGLTLQQSSEA